jgi:hypothetical protein
MTFTERFDTLLTGLFSGIILPFIVAVTVYIFSPGNFSLQEYIARIADSNIITHTITLSVFPNVIIFLIFNRFDMLRASRGVLAVTILWAILVFSIKLFQ